MTDLRIGATVPCTEMEGPFARFAVWVRGCSLGCRGCCNPELFDPSGPTTPITNLVTQIVAARDEHGIEGVSILGGEPLEQPHGVASLARATQELGLGVIVFTGYRMDEPGAQAPWSRVWPHVDTMIDGRFDGRQLEPPPAPSAGRRFVGSRNQRILHRTSRYSDPHLWSGQNGAEVWIDPQGSIQTHGFPSLVTALLRSV